jgi:hypothetical protein
MKNLLLIPTMLLAACATTGGGSSKGSSAPFQGADAVTKRRGEIADAAKAANDDCLKTMKATDGFHGAMFVVTADAAGKLSIEPVRWTGPDAAKQCILGESSKVTVTPLPGPSVSSTWEWNPPAPEKAPQVVMPPDLETKVQSLQTQSQVQVEACEQQNLPPEMPADISIAFLVDAQGKTHGPTVLSSTAKDGGFDSCVQGVITKMQFPASDVQVPYPVTLRFHVGRLEKL